MYTLFHNSGVVAKMKTNNPLGSLYCQKALGTGLYCSTPYLIFVTFSPNTQLSMVSTQKRVNCNKTFSTFGKISYFSSSVWGKLKNLSWTEIGFFCMAAFFPSKYPICDICDKYQVCSNPNFSPALYYCTMYSALPRKLPLAPKISPGSHRLGGHSLEWYMRPQIKRCRNISSSKIHISHFRNSHFQQKTGWVPLVSLSHLLIEPTNMWKVESFELLSSCIDIFIASDYFEWGFEQTSRAFSNHFALLCFALQASLGHHKPVESSQSIFKMIKQIFITIVFTTEQ